MLFRLIKLDLNCNIIRNLDRVETWFYLNDEIISSATNNSYANKYDDDIEYKFIENRIIF